MVGRAAVLEAGACSSPPDRRSSDRPDRERSQYLEPDADDHGPRVGVVTLAAAAPPPAVAPAPAAATSFSRFDEQPQPDFGWEPPPTTASSSLLIVLSIALLATRYGQGVYSVG